MRLLGPRQAILPMALFIGLWFNFSTPALAAQAVTPSKPVTAASSIIEDENAAVEDDPDENLVPLDTESSLPEAASSSKTTASRVPRTEDLIQLNPAGTSPATVRFSDALNPQAELTQMQDPSRSAADQTEYTSYDIPIVLDSSVQAHIRYFNTAIHGRFGEWLFRLSRYRPLVETIFTEFHLPSDLV
jgi:membrane-bound lytic murein transglycosylase D